MAKERQTPDGMVWIEGGTFIMGSDHNYAEERPAHPVRVDGFFIDRGPVTNRQFAAFAAATGHVTFAERAPDPRDYPGAPAAMLKPGSLVFFRPEQPTGLSRWRDWWRFVLSADWRHPLGPESNLDGLEDHPVVHVTAADAEAYALWAGKSLPTEAEWEFAARGGLAEAEFAWGHELYPDGKPMANIWQGRFPDENLLLDGYERTSPVGAFPENGYGLHDMIGNVWEWTADWWADNHPGRAASACCAPKNPRGGTLEASLDPAQPASRIPRRVLKGGSHLCAPNYCRRYRPAARHPEPVDTSTGHVGFRCVLRG